MRVLKLLWGTGPRDAGGNGEGPGSCNGRARPSPRPLQPVLATGGATTEGGAAPGGAAPTEGGAAPGGAAPAEASAAPGGAAPVPAGDAPGEVDDGGDTTVAVMSAATGRRVEPPATPGFERFPVLIDAIRLALSQAMHEAAESSEPGVVSEALVDAWADAEAMVADEALRHNVTPCSPHLLQLARDMVAMAAQNFGGLADAGRRNTVRLAAASGCEAVRRRLDALGSKGMFPDEPGAAPGGTPAKAPGPEGSAAPAARPPLPPLPRGCCSWRRALGRLLPATCP